MSGIREAGRQMKLLLTGGLIVVGLALVAIYNILVGPFTIADAAGSPLFLSLPPWSVVLFIALF